ncbi:MAG: hypothetical protein JWL59_1795 [Chthoniobacteraceae bacterium]|nr:hypothetical protein [Chthoniobacteraceae bacterium]
MKLSTAISAAAFLVVLIFAVSNRYTLSEDGQMRLDRWTGKSRLLISPPETVPIAKP